MMTVKDLVASLQDLPKEYQDREVSVAYDGQVNYHIDVITTFHKKNWTEGDPERDTHLIVLSNREDFEIKDKWS